MSRRYGAFPEGGGVRGVPTIRIIIVASWGLYWVPLHFGKLLYHNDIMLTLGIRWVSLAATLCILQGYKPQRNLYMRDLEQIYMCTPLVDDKTRNWLDYAFLSKPQLKLSSGQSMKTSLGLALSCLAFPNCVTSEFWTYTSLASESQAPQTLNHSPHLQSLAHQVQAIP